MTLFLLAVMTLAPAATVSPDPAVTWKVATFNIRYDTPKDGENRWPKRTGLVFGTIRKMAADLLGVQEVLANQFDELKAALPEYEAVGVGRNDGKRDGEFAPIFFRAKRFEKLADGTFWLSETPDKIGSLGWDANIPRIATWVRLKDRTHGKTLLFVNTHFDHLGVRARLESARLLRSRIEAMRETEPVIVVGDFNTDEDSDAYGILLGTEPDGLRLVDSYRAAHLERLPDEASFNGFEGKRAGSRIDWILHTSELKTLTSEIVRDAEGKRYPSDHFPVAAELSYQKK